MSYEIPKIIVIQLGSTITNEMCPYVCNKVVTKNTHKAIELIKD